jgi:hypothetical protein
VSACAWEGQQSTHHDRSVVDQHVNPAPCLNDLVDNADTALLVSDVLREQETFPASRIDERLGLLSIDLLLWEIDNGDL